MSTPESWKKALGGHVRRINRRWYRIVKRFPGVQASPWDVYARVEGGLWEHLAFTATLTSGKRAAEEHARSDMNQEVWLQADGDRLPLIASKNEDGTYTMQSFSNTEETPLVPGDTVKVEHHNIVGVVDARPVFLLEAHLTFTIDTADYDALASKWSAACDVGQTSPVSMLVASTDRQWLQTEVHEHPLVAATYPLRFPPGRTPFDGTM